jgi:hypothetical protein
MLSRGWSRYSVLAEQTTPLFDPIDYLPYATLCRSDFHSILGRGSIQCISLLR